jgi:hypothetical protein
MINQKKQSVQYSNVGLFIEHIKSLTDILSLNSYGRNGVSIILDDAINS